MESWVQSWRPRTNAFCDFPPHLSKVLRLPRKSDARSYEVLHMSRKIIFPKLKIWCSIMQPLSGNQRPDLLTALMNMSLALRLLRKMHLCRSSSHVPRLPSFLKCYKTLTFCSLLTRSTIPCACHAKRRFNVQKWRKYMVSIWCFVDFDFDMCFAPQRRALFRQLNFQKWSDPLVFCHFSLGNVLRATTACTFSTSQRPKVLWTHQLLTLLTWKCASRHNGVQFFISPLASWLRSRRFSEPTFRPSGATNHLKNTVFRDFPAFSRTWIFFLLNLSLFDLISSSLLFSDSSHFCFSSVHTVGSLTSKLPSISSVCAPYKLHNMSST